jgi:hypothetical protein
VIYPICAFKMNLCFENKVSWAVSSRGRAPVLAYSPGNFSKLDVAMTRSFAPVYQPSHARLGPRQDLLTGAIQKEKKDYKRGNGHKQDREDH